MFQNILVAVDGSEHARHAVGYAAGLARALGARLTIVHVMTHLGSDRIPEDLRTYGSTEHVEVNEAQMLRQVASSLLEEAKDLASDRGASDVRTVLEAGDPAGRIITACSDQNADLVVMGQRGRGDFTSLLLGSVSHKVVQLAPCPCMTVPVSKPSLAQAT